MAQRGGRGHDQAPGQPQDHIQVLLQQPEHDPRREGLPHRRRGRGQPRRHPAGGVRRRVREARRQVHPQGPPLEDTQHPQRQDLCPRRGRPHGRHPQLGGRTDTRAPGGRPGGRGDKGVRGEQPRRRHGRGRDSRRAPPPLPGQRRHHQESHLGARGTPPPRVHGAHRQTGGPGGLGGRRHHTRQLRQPRQQDHRQNRWPRHQRGHRVPRRRPAGHLHGDNPDRGQR